MEKLCMRHIKEILLTDKRLEFKAHLRACVSCEYAKAQFREPFGIIRRIDFLKVGYSLFYKRAYFFFQIIYLCYHFIIIIYYLISKNKHITYYFLSNKLSHPQ